MALIRTTAEAIGNDEYDLRVGIAWTGGNPLVILTKDTQGYTYDGVSTPLHHYTPVETTVNAIEPALDYFWHVYDLAQDCVNQGGISNVLMICPPDRNDQE
ncbi:putative transcriptional regulator with HTH domain protein [Mycobacterium kansasii]|nr:putative transcriptional regulator with HTH domain protein [Mycobacterium kansasii]